MADDFKMNLNGVAPSSEDVWYLPKGRYVARVVRTSTTGDTKYGNSGSLTCEILRPETPSEEREGYEGSSVVVRLFIPDGTMRAKVEEVAKAEKKKDSWADNFFELMQQKWVSLSMSMGVSPKDGIDARKLLKRAEGELVVVVASDRKKKKPTDRDASNFDISADQAKPLDEAQFSADEGDDDEFDLDDI